MKRAKKKDKSVVVQILSQSLKDNKSVNYVVQQDSNRLSRTDKLMEYSFMTCMDFGEVFLSEDRKCCALVLFPDRKKVTLGSAWRDLRLIFSVTGIRSVFKVLKREALIRKQHPSDGKLYYIWYIGCALESQSKGRGTLMMEFLLSKAERMNRPVYLETSTERNISWYKKFGFQIFDARHLGYTLYFLRKEK